MPHTSKQSLEHFGGYRMSLQKGARKDTGSISGEEVSAWNMAHCVKSYEIFAMFTL